MRQLSRQETLIMQQTSLGFTAKEIAKKMGLAPRTVEMYLTNIRKKLNAKNAAHAVYLIHQQNSVNL